MVYSSTRRLAKQDRFWRVLQFFVCRRASTEKEVPATFMEGRADCRHRREPHMGHHIKKLTVLLALCVAMVVAAPAWAQGGNDGYENGGENVAGGLAGAEQGGGGGGGAPEATSPTSETSGSSLPFTGLDIALILGVGGALTAVGLGTRRLTRQPDTA
jgi:hypothetical protein